MPEEQLKAFLEKVKGDTSLQEQLKAAANADAVVAIAKNAGFIISGKDLTNLPSANLTEADLEGVAGGGATGLGGTNCMVNGKLICNAT